MEEGPSPPKITRVEEKAKKINIIVKTYFQKVIIEVDEDASVQDLRRLAAERFDCSCRRLCFIFGGKIMKDSDSLVTHGVGDGDLIHLLVKGTNISARDDNASNDNINSEYDNESTTNENIPSNIDSTADDNANEEGVTTSLDEEGDLSGMAALGLNPVFSRRYQNMERELTHRPDRLWRPMEEPWVQELMADPALLPEVMDLTQQLMADRGLLREVMAYPQAERLSQLDRDAEDLMHSTVRDPGVFRRYMDSASDPAILSALQEVVHSQSPAFPDFESMPGSNAMHYSYSILQHVYRDFQDDVLVDGSEQHSWRSDNPGDISPERTQEDVDANGNGGSAEFFDEVD